MVVLPPPDPRRFPLVGTRRDQAALVRESERARPNPQVKLVQSPARMRLDGGLAEVEPRGDLCLCAGGGLITPSSMSVTAAGGHR